MPKDKSTPDIHKGPRKKAEQSLPRRLKKEPKVIGNNERLIRELQVHQIELEMQNEALLEARSEIEESRSRYIDLYDFAPVGYLTFDKAGLIKEINLTAARLLGAERQFLVGKPFTFFLKAESQDTFHLHKQSTLRSSETETCELSLKTKDGATFTARLESVSAMVKGHMVMRSVLTDITERKQAEDLKAALREKELLLKEVHHRVKNNLQVISSLLNLQSQHMSDPKAQDAFKVSMDRIKTMALIHDKLYREKNLSGIYFPDYAGDLAHDLITAYAMGKPIVLNLDIDPFTFEIDRAVTLGLVINELVSNSLKHAFPGEEGGMITIRFSEQDHRGALVISDTGIGFPENLDFMDTQSMGMQLVVTLVEQLEGTIELKKGRGTEFRIAFNL
jgi:PAS domain S-box-containing protein